ncbi:MAG TPA: hypothetical protein VEM57_01350 [Candidatus Binatus sp.]|nr:hypothetical protein [Candidatus Binatus sp.]
MSALARIAIVTGDTAASRAVAGAAATLLTAVGRPVEQVGARDDLTPYAAAILTRSHDWPVVRERRVGPVLVLDADLFGARVDPAFAHLLGGPPTDHVTVGSTRVLLPRPLPSLAGRPLGDLPPGLVTEAEPGVGYGLPVVVAPALRTIGGFWSLAALVEQAVAALVGERTPLYAEPWPRGFRAARALTYDLDGLDGGNLPPMVASRPATAFCCADALPYLGAAAADLEIAAHGDVHRAFDDPATNLGRIDHMLDAFHAAGLTPRGFSPPNTVYSSPLGPLLERFSYVRIGYQERALRFFPEAVGRGFQTSASYYPDFMQRYVGTAEYTRLLARFCDWAEATSILAIPCFHPCLWADPLHAFLDAPVGGVWETTLAEVLDWWAHRQRALAAVAEAGEGASPPDVVLVRSTPAARLASLRPVDGERPPTTGPRSAVRVKVDGRRVRVVPAADGPAASVDVPLGLGWRPLGWLPARLRRATSRALIRVTNKNGLHACFYQDLGLTPDVRSGSLRLPVVAADEPLMVTHPGAADLGRVARGMVRRLARVASHA